jgi:hypothetical protein
MKRTTILLLGLALCFIASIRGRGKAKPGWAQHLKGWQKVFGVVAVLLTLLIVLNPEFLPLGFLGDAAFFDMMVLALSLQLHMYAVRAFRTCVNGLSWGLRWLRVPSPGTYYLLVLSTSAIGTAVSALQKAVHRILS